MLIVAAIVLIKPGLMSDLFGLLLIGLTAASQRWLRPPAAPRSEESGWSPVQADHSRTVARQMCQGLPTLRRKLAPNWHQTNGSMF